MEIYDVGKSIRYPDSLKYGLIFVDSKTGHKVLMDNHHPKGHHVHLGEQEFPYHYVDENKLVVDFKAFVLANMGVNI